MKQLFGTDGIRSSVDGDLLKPENLVRIAHAAGVWLQAQQCQKIFIACDTRESSTLIKNILCSVLSHYIHSIHDCDVIPSPALAWLCKQYTTYGVMITASHNPYTDNGIKFFRPDGTKSSDVDETSITENYHTITNQLVPDTQRSSINASALSQNYIQALAHFFKPNFLNGLRVALDCANGAWWQLAPFVFSQYGSDVITINAQPNGKNINANCGATHPKSLQQAVLTCQANIGIAFDGDGDRVIFCAKNGEIKDGDDLLYLLLTHPAYATNKIIVGTTMSNEGLNAYCTLHDITFLRTSVGDKHITKSLVEHNALIGAEQSGHVICRDFLPTGDGLFAALRVLESCLLTNNLDMQTFEKYGHFSAAVTIKEKKNLQEMPYYEILRYYQEQVPNGRIVVRYSGTEPVLRIMVEDKQQHRANTIGEQLTAHFEKMMQKD